MLASLPGAISWNQGGTGVRGIIPFYNYAVVLPSRPRERTRSVERAYISGGGPVNWPATPPEFILQIENYGKTPAYLTAYAVTTTDLATP